MKKNYILLTFLFFCKLAMAQYGTSAGSLSYIRDATTVSSNRGYNSFHTLPLPNSRTLIVEDFMNYHKHKITIPTTEEVAISIDYSNSSVEDKDECVIQVGLATQPSNFRNSQSNKLNICLVVDVSFSMTGKKIETAREALRRFVQSLENDNYLSIVLFDSEAEVVLPTTRITDKRESIYSIIKAIEPRGATNLNAGMILGYKEVLKKHSNQMNSRVILLTDGMTNTGETNHDQIISNSVRYNNKGIEISTIGVGQSLDFALLRNIADKGRGSNYFIGENEEDMYKVFSDELNALKYGIGKSPSVTISLPREWEIQTCYGYKPVFEKNNTVTIDINNLGANSTRIFMIKAKKNRKDNGIISASVNYKKDGELISKKTTRIFDCKTDITNNELQKNYEISVMAQSLKDAALSTEEGTDYKTRNILSRISEQMKYSPYITDPDFQRVYAIVQQYSPQKPKRRCGNEPRIPNLYY